MGRNMSIVMTRICAACVGICFGHGSFSQSSTWFDRDASGSATQAMATSTMAANGFLLGSIQNGGVVVTNYDFDGTIQWSRNLAIPDVPPLRWLHTIEFIDDGPAFYILASSVPSHPFTFSERYYLVEFNDDLSPVIMVSPEDTSSNCGTHFMQHSRLGHAQRIPSGGYFINMPGNPNFNCVCRLDSTGALEWWRLYSAADWTTDENRYFSGFRGSPLSDGGMLLPNTVEGGFHIHRLDSDGNIVWANKYITGSVYDQAWRALELPDGSILLTGLHGINIGDGSHWLFLMKLDPDGQIIWHRRVSNDQGSINYPGFPYDLSSGNDGSILIRTHLYSSRDRLIRFDSNGIVQEMIQLEQTSGFQEGVSIDVLPTSEILVTGSVQDDFDPEWVESPFVSITSDLASIACNTVPIQWIDEPYPTSVTIVETGAVINYSHFIFSEVSVQTNVAEWVRDEACGPTSSGHPHGQGEFFRAFPTVVSSSGSITLEHRSRPKQVRMLNVVGAEVHLAPLSGNDIRSRISVPDVASGTYVLVIEWANGTYNSTRVLVEE
jgi:hypothetical protein